jgi:hypothetical protein
MDDSHTRTMISKDVKHMRPIDLRRGDICETFLVLEDAKVNRGVVSVFLQYTTDGAVETRQWGIKQAETHCIRYNGKLDLIMDDDTPPRDLWRAYLQTVEIP